MEAIMSKRHRKTKDFISASEAMMPKIGIKRPRAVNQKVASAAVRKNPPFTTCIDLRRKGWV